MHWTWVYGYGKTLIIYNGRIMNKLQNILWHNPHYEVVVVVVSTFSSEETELKGYIEKLGSYSTEIGTQAVWLWNPDVCSLHFAISDPLCNFIDTLSALLHLHCV